MPNLFGLRDMPSASSVDVEAKKDTLKAMQMEALGLRRRELLSTTDFKENRASYVSTLQLETQRLVHNISIGRGEKSKLEGWNNAWTHLHDDGTESQKLQDVNEGLGQTHRAKLMEDDSVREYMGEFSIRGARGGKGGRGYHAGRGGGNAGRATGRGGRAKAKEDRRFTLPITRVRVPKGQPDVPRRQPAPMMRPVSTTRSTKVNVNIPNLPVLSTQRPILLAAPSAFMASINVHKEQYQNESNVEIAPPAAKTPKEEAVEKPIAHVVNSRAVDMPSVHTATAAGKRAISVGSPPKADLMDLDIGQETLQPVLQFTSPSTKKGPDDMVVEESLSFDQKIEALERSGVLSATQLEALKTIQAQVHARTKPLTPEEASRRAIYSRSELELLNPASRASKVNTGIARQFSEEQNAFFIGEHIHKTRYHNAASLTEDFEKLSIVETKPAKPAAPDTEEKSKSNPFGHLPAKGTGLSLPAHLLNRTSTVDHGAAARTQYSYSNRILAPVSDQQTLGGFTTPTRPTRRNKINETGFIALVENHAAGK